MVGIAVINALASAGGFFGPFLIGKLATPGDTIVGMTVPMVALSLAFVLLLFVKVPAPDKKEALPAEVLDEPEQGPSVLSRETSKSAVDQS